MWNERESGKRAFYHEQREIFSCILFIRERERERERERAGVALYNRLTFDLFNLFDDL